MRIRIECGLDSQSRAGVWPNDRAGVRAVRTLQGSKNAVQIRFGCGLDSRIYGNHYCTKRIVILLSVFKVLTAIKIIPGHFSHMREKGVPTI
jgi:hypothetical protein